MYFTWKFSPVGDLGFFFFFLLSIVTTFGDLTMADHGLIYSNGICTNSERVLFAF